MARYPPVSCSALKFKLNGKNLKSVMEDVDRDGNGSVSWEEFLYWWTGIE